MSADRRTPPRGIRFDATINLGNVLAIAALVISIFAWSVEVSERLTAIETKINPVWEAFTKGR
jgi:hypothetical protein